MTKRSRIDESQGPGAKTMWPSASTSKRSNRTTYWRSLSRSGPASVTGDTVGASSGVNDQSEALVLEADELADGGGNKQPARNQMRLDLCHDLRCCLLLCILLTGGDLTGLPMDSLVSYEEQNAAPLEALDADVRVVRVGPIRGRLV